VLDIPWFVFLLVSQLYECIGGGKTRTEKLCGGCCLLQGAVVGRNIVQCTFGSVTRTLAIASVCITSPATLPGVQWCKGGGARCCTAVVRMAEHARVMLPCCFVALPASLILTDNSVWMCM
jgi:hypothetical protein